MPSCWTTQTKQIFHLYRKLFVAWFCSAFLYVPICSQANIGQAQNIEEKSRLEFRQAVKALQVGDYERFKYLADRNRDYLLYPYLHFFDLKSRLATASEREVKNFIKNYADTPLSSRMKYFWIKELAKQKRWDVFLREYNKRGGAKLQCQYLHAAYKKQKSKKQRKRIIKKAKKLWMSGSRQPKECIPLFDLLYDKKLISASMLWQRIELAMKKGNTKIAGYLAKKLRKKDRAVVKAWQIARRNPPKLLKLKALKRNNKRNRNIVLTTVKAYARRNAEKARSLWAKIKKKYKFSSKERHKMQRYIALRSSYQLHPKAYTWLSEISPKWVNSDVRIWRVRAALRRKDWRAIHSSIKAMTKQERAGQTWQYWLARAKEALGKKSEAK